MPHQGSPFPEAESLPAANMPDIKTMKDHLIIIGYGVNGRNVATIQERGNTLCNSDIDPETVKSCLRGGEPIRYGDDQSMSSEHWSRAPRVIVIAISDRTETSQDDRTGPEAESRHIYN